MWRWNVSGGLSSWRQLLRIRRKQLPQHPCAGKQIRFADFTLAGVVVCKENLHPAPPFSLGVCGRFPKQKTSRVLPSCLEGFDATKRGGGFKGPDSHTRWASRSCHGTAMMHPERGRILHMLKNPSVPGLDPQARN